MSVYVDREKEELPLTESLIDQLENHKKLSVQLKRKMSKIFFDCVSYYEQDPKGTIAKEGYFYKYITSDGKVDPFAKYCNNPCELPDGIVTMFGEKYREYLKIGYKEIPLYFWYILQNLHDDEGVWHPQWGTTDFGKDKIHSIKEKLGL